jgi:serine/threonine-protein kinase HipA
MVAKVKLWNELVGAVLWDKNMACSRFEFDENFLKKGWDISPLTMPASESLTGKKTYSFPAIPYETYKGLPGLLADSLPDKFGNKLIDTWLSRQGRNPESIDPVERLCYIGKRGMGALEYEPSTELFKNTSEHLEIKELVGLAKEVLSEKKNLKTNLHKKSDEGLLQIISVGTSAGGARAKAIIAYNEETGDVRSGQIDDLKNYNYWIIKFDGVTNKFLGDPAGYGRIEFAYHKMAINAGIKMSECRLLEENSRAHFMTRRFDRTEDNTKLHMQTLCAISHFDYNDPTSYSYEQAFQVMRELRLPYNDAEQLFLRMAFNVIARNQDDHTKNISFLMDQSGTWSLSPAYDVTYAYDPQNKWMKNHQLSVNGKHTEITKEDLLSVAKEMNIKKANNLIEQITDSVRTWKKVAKEVGIPKEQIDEIAKTHIIYK